MNILEHWTFNLLLHIRKKYIAGQKVFNLSTKKNDTLLIYLFYLSMVIFSVLSYRSNFRIYMCRWG